MDETFDGFDYLPLPAVDDSCPLCDHVQFWDGVEFIHNITGSADCPEDD